MDLFPDEILLKILSYLDKRDLCFCSRVNKKWNRLTYTEILWSEFSLSDIMKPKWCASKLVSIENTHYLIQKRFSPNITRVDLAKLCFSFDTLDILFNACQHIKSLVINFKYLQIKGRNKYLVDNCIHNWPVNKLEKLYLKNVCDMKTRRIKSLSSTFISFENQAYDIIELQIIKLIRTLFRRNSNSLRVLGLKCVDPNIISSCVMDFDNLEILLLNNVNDTDSVLQELASVCKKLKCLELNKCREFKGDGLQEIIDQCTNLETLQIGKHIYPTITELNEINWFNLKYQLRELSITTKFTSNNNLLESHSSSSSSPNSTSSNSSLSSKSSNYFPKVSSSSLLNMDNISTWSMNSSIDLYSSTIFNYLNDQNELKYLALEDFTLKFPSDDRHDLNKKSDKRSKKNKRIIKTPLKSLHKYKQIKLSNKMEINSNDEKEENDQINDIFTNTNNDLDLFLPLVKTYNENKLKFLFLRNIRNITQLTTYQSANLKSFLLSQTNLHTLDLIGIYLSSKFICSVIKNLHQLQVFHFGHGKSYKKASSLNHFISEISGEMVNLIDIDTINYELSKNCSYLREFGIFYRQTELKFKRDHLIECKNDALIILLQSCAYLKEIKYLKSFKINDDDDQDHDFKNIEEYEINEENVLDSYNKSKKNIFIRKRRSYFHFIKYAIENASIKSNHVNMQPCYGYDITPSSGHLLDNKNNFIETSLPPIKPPSNDFHINLLSA